MVTVSHLYTSLALFIATFTVTVHAVHSGAQALDRASTSPVPLAQHSNQQVTLPHASLTEIQLTAALLILEAGGETEDEAMPAVLEVLYNRVHERGQTLTQVIIAPKQFSPMENTTIAGAIAAARNHPKWTTALQLAAKGAPQTNYSRGADHFHSSAVSPYWATSQHRTARIGNHIFYALP
jgi:spore germination cell wall hydrolase CwlJ-like protein